jgi:hypothetical protein
MPAFPTKQISVEIYLTLEDDAERHEVLELSHTILPLEEKIECCLTVSFNLLVNDRRISTCQETSILGEEMFNSFRSHDSPIGVVWCSAERTLQKPIDFDGKVQRSVHVLTIDAVICVTKKSLGVNQVMSWLILARGFVVSVENFLCSNR